MTWKYLEHVYKHGSLEEFLKVAESRHHHGISVRRNDAYIMLRECSKLQDINFCRRVQRLMASSGLESIGVLGDHLIRLFGINGSLPEANEAFYKVARPTEYTWSAIIDAHATFGEGQMALQLYNSMLHSGTNSCKYAYLAALKACASTVDLEQGRRIHEQIIESRLQSDMPLGNTLVAMYAKCGSFKEARKIFDNLSQRNVVSWGAMITGYAQHGEGLSALECYEQMQHDGIIPNKVIFVSILKACGTIGAIQQGKAIHRHIVKDGLGSDYSVATALIDMYAKCGVLDEACRVFNEMTDRDVVSWSAIISAYAQCGNFKLAQQHFDSMLEQAIKPDEVTFTNILAACHQAGLVDEGRKYFEIMKEDHGITPSTCHQNCMVEMLSHAGHLDEAERILQGYDSDTIGWMSLLIACKRFRNVKMARRCFEQIVRLDSSCAAAYVLLSSIYFDLGTKNDAVRIEELTKFEEAWKKPAKVWIEANGKVHEFVAGDQSLPQNEQVHATMKKLKDCVNKGRNERDLCLGSQQGPRELRRDPLYGHVEKLAVAFGFLHTSLGDKCSCDKEPLNVYGLS